MEIQEVRVSFGGPGHMGEYIAHVEDDAMPYLTRKLQELLVGWDVTNRGSRIEIFNTTLGYGYRNDFAVDAVMRKIVKDVVWREEPLQRYDLSMIRVLDEEHFDETGELRTVNCAIMRDRRDSWLVKPLAESYFDAREWMGHHTAFNMAWWSISKSDLSAEVIDEKFDVNVIHKMVVPELRHDFEAIWQSMHR